MDDLSEEYYKPFLDTNMFLQSEDLDSWVFDEPLSGYYDSSSPDGGGATSPAANSKNIVSERNRRRKLNEQLFALRAVVPNISKMDKASIIKDAIDYIQELQEDERRIQAEIFDLEHGRPDKTNSVLMSRSYHLDGQQQKLLSPSSNLVMGSKKKKAMSARNLHRRSYNSCGSHRRVSGMEDVELRFSYIGDKTLAVSLTCSKRAGAIVKLCELFESLKLKIITAHISAFSGKLFKTVLIEAAGDHLELLKINLEAAVANLSQPESPMSV